MRFKIMPLTLDASSKPVSEATTKVDVDVCDSLMAALNHGSRSLRLSRNGYVYFNTDENGHRQRHYLHRWVMRAPAGLDVDHINGDRQDNRKKNLRLCSRSQNMQKAKKRSGTKSRFRGLSWDRTRQKWMVTIQADAKLTYIGRFDDEEEAARAYDAAAKRLHGEFANLNFP